MTQSRWLWMIRIFTEMFQTVWNVVGLSIYITQVPHFSSLPGSGNTYPARMALSLSPYQSVPCPPLLYLFSSPPSSSCLVLWSRCPSVAHLTRLHSVPLCLTETQLQPDRTSALFILPGPTVHGWTLKLHSAVSYRHLSFPGHHFSLCYSIIV